MYSALGKLGKSPIYCTVIAITVSWDCVESRHKIVKVSASLSFKSESIDLAEACHAAAWKGNIWRTASPNLVNMASNIFQSRCIGASADSYYRPFTRKRAF